MKTRALFFLITGLITQACGESVAYNLQSSQDYTYEFSTPDCSTGQHKLPTIGAYCMALQDSVLNQNCAEDFRKDEFKTQCQYMSWGSEHPPQT